MQALRWLLLLLVAYSSLTLGCALPPEQEDAQQQTNRDHRGGGGGY